MSEIVSALIVLAVVALSWALHLHEQREHEKTRSALRSAIFRSHGIHYEEDV